MSEIQASLEWSSILKAVLDIDVRSGLPGLDKSGVIAYTDGACIKNPGGPAGWSALLWAAVDAVGEQLPRQAPCVECYGHIPKSPTTTNNRAEISAVLAVLSIAPPTLPLTIYSDSEYTIKVATGVYQMKANPDLWEIYRQMLSYRKAKPKFIWVRGHAGHEQNERADYLAGLGAWNNNKDGFEHWQSSQTPEARSGLSSSQINTIRKQVQQLQAYVDTIDPDSGRVTQQERKFIADMTKRLRKNNFVPSDKQSSWLQKLVVKYHL
ncbi:ribonuclease HI [Dictyobacter halimunensis]|uniref:ribonuclease HI n=1 Tax=Dictyobacter halimunensis TaxID=3026934 RepID=UPI0030C6B3B6